ncbi:MAG: DNA alkylation repair protein [Acidobacteria bacterium]|nr:DNA alkylation repair protein [Acidobacteriota bacterium]
MTIQEVLQQLEALGTEQARKVYRQHGITTPMFGVSYAHLGKLQKKLKTNHDLAVELWNSGNHDARILATMIADPKQLTLAQVEACVDELSNYVITDALTGLVAKTSVARQVLDMWKNSETEWTGQLAWGILGRLAVSDSTLPDDFFKPYLDIIEREIHTRPNRVRHSMNGALIGIGMRNAQLEAEALRIAAAIGKVKVDHGQTSCKTPDAASYIKKAKARGAK